MKWAVFYKDTLIIYVHDASTKPAGSLSHTVTQAIQSVREETVKHYDTQQLQYISSDALAPTAL